MKLFRYFIILFALTNKLLAQNEALTLANQAYAKGDYEQAVLKYNQLIKEGFNNADLYFNLGNAYYQTNQVSLSILNFERAAKLEPGSEKIEHNLRLAYLQTKNQFEPLPKLFFVKWWHTYLSKKTTSQWGKQAITFIWIAFGLSITRLFIKKKWLTYLAGFCVFLSAFYSFIAFQKNQFDSNNEMAIVMQAEIELKETPNNNAKTIITLYEGLKVQIIDQVDNWSQVKLEDGKSAWIETQFIERI